MNKLQLIAKLVKFYKDFDIVSTQCHVSHGGALVLLGLKDQTDDIDLVVTQQVWDKFKSYSKTQLNALGDYKAKELISIDDDIDLHLIDDQYPLVITVVDGIYLTDLNTTLLDKLRLNRDKDQQQINLLINAGAYICVNIDNCEINKVCANYDVREGELYEILEDWEGSQMHWKKNEYIRPINGKLFIENVGELDISL